MPELEVRLPYAAWGDDAWEGGSEELMNALEEALSASGLGDQDDPDHDNDHIAYFLIGDDVAALAQLASDVLARHGVLEHATAVVVDTNAWDAEADTYAQPTETVVELPTPSAHGG